MGSPGEQFTAAQRGGALGIKAVMPELSLGEARAMQGMTREEIERAKEDRGFWGDFPMRSSRSVQAEDGSVMNDWAAQAALEKSRKVEARGSIEAFRSVSSVESGWDRTWQVMGNVLGDVLSGKFSGLLGELNRMHGETRDAIRDLKER